MNAPSQDEALRRENDRLLNEYMPIIFFMTIMGVIGVAGNSVTLFFYRGTQHTSTTVLIVGLAVVDLIVSCLSFIAVADMAIKVVNADRFLCKCFFLSVHWMISSSVMILCAISVDRYLTMCRPMWPQFTVRKSKLAISISIVVAFLISVRDLFTYDIVVVSFTEDGKVGYNLTNASFVRFICSSTKDIELRSILFGFKVVDVISVISILLTNVFAYGNIVRKLCEHSQKMAAAGMNTTAVSNAGKTDQSVYIKTETSDILKSQATRYISMYTVTTDDKSNTDHFNLQNDDDANQSVMETGNSPKTAVSQTVSKKAVKKQRNSPKSLNWNKQAERNLTIMMLAVTIGFFICFIPHFAVSVGQRSKTHPGKILQAPSQFAVRSPFWNSVINPILYCVFNPRYRLYLKSIFKCN